VLAVYGELSHCLGSYQALRALRPDAAAAVSPGVGHFHPAVEPAFFMEMLGRFLTAVEGEAMTKRILLVSPLADNEKLWVTGDEELCGDSLNNFVPLGLATVAALTPRAFQVDIWDELVHGKLDGDVTLPHRYDLVGITGYKAHLPRCRQVSAYFRAQGIPTAIGGPGVSASPD
jgi:hypothetical protein